MVLTGHCLCKAVTYSIDMDKLFSQNPNARPENCPDTDSLSLQLWSLHTTTAMTASARADQHIVQPFPRPTFHTQPSQLTKTTALVAVVLKDKLTIKGPTKSWAGKGSSGQAVHRIFCSECGSPIAHDPDSAPPIIAIKAGTLDTEIKKGLKPDTEIWTAGKLPFMTESLPNAFEHMPPS
ncbi:hypothetical protein BP6252_10414 [Coleophoma cylindrospora]|uniref:CENP-V/GFA domain-containing protein n=1 Tax=Coleophoma cylindrospora TaxID=1849047 RepID=A0A3D8QSG1_9HELO|nr:hypothetical protein BP6252_10414 [Coleophoma cylindrospora]